MKEKRKTYMADEDIEDLLSPKCDFHASPGFMDRVIAEAEAYSARRQRRRLWWMYSGAAAAVAALVVITILVGNKMETQPNTPIIASVEPATTHPTLPAIEDEIYEEKSDNANIQIEKNKIMTKNNVKNNVIKKESMENLGSMVEILETTSTEEVKYDVYAIVEGPMEYLQDMDQKNSAKLMLSTDEFDEYTRLVRQTYIERVRYEIAETETYIQEMRENVLESI